VALPGGALAVSGHGMARHGAHQLCGAQANLQRWVGATETALVRLAACTVARRRVRGSANIVFRSGEVAIGHGVIP